MTRYKGQETASRGRTAQIAFSSGHASGGHTQATSDPADRCFYWSLLGAVLGLAAVAGWRMVKRG